MAIESEIQTRAALILGTCLLLIGSLVACDGSTDEPGGGTGGGTTGGGAGGGTSGGSRGDDQGPSEEQSPALPTSWPPGEDVSCPDATFPNPVSAPSSLASIVSACSASAGYMLVTNISPVMIRVTPSAATSVGSAVARSAEFSDVVNAQIALQQSSSSWVMVPPGGYLTARSSQGSTAGVSVDVPRLAAATAYSGDVISRYISNKVKNRPQRLQGAAVDCIKEAAEILSTQPQNQSAEVTDVLAEIALGPGYACKKLVGDVSEATDGERQTSRSALRTEFDEFAKSAKGSVVDDVVAWARRLVQVSPRG